MNGLNVGKLRDLERSLERLPLVVAQKVAERVAGKLTERVRATFDAGENAYGDAWAPSVVDGKKVTLVRTGRLRKDLAYAATGTRLRARLVAKEARYQVGKRPIMPRNGAPLPLAWRADIDQATADVVRAELGQGA